MGNQTVSDGTPPKSLGETIEEEFEKVDEALNGLRKDIEWLFEQLRWQCIGTVCEQDGEDWHLVSSNIDDCETEILEKVEWARNEIFDPEVNELHRKLQEEELRAEVERARQTISAQALADKHREAAEKQKLMKKWG